MIIVHKSKLSQLFINHKWQMASHLNCVIYEQLIFVNNEVISKGTE